ncbi:MAG: RNA recognition motif domain-containing protein [Desulfovermiculus sp.]
MKRMYVGNLPFSSTEEDVRALFSRFGEVGTVHLVHDRETGRPRGFGFVEMQTEAATQAMSELNGVEFSGRTLKVNEAKPKRTFTPRPQSS